MYDPLFSQSLEKELDKLKKRAPERYDQVLKKMREVAANPLHYKNLRAPLNRFRRVHIDSSFVLVFSVDERRRTVTFENLGHHKEVYKHSFWQWLLRMF